MPKISTILFGLCAVVALSTTLFVLLTPSGAFGGDVQAFNDAMSMCFQASVGLLILGFIVLFLEMLFGNKQ